RRSSASFGRSRPFEALLRHVRAARPASAIGDFGRAPDGDGDRHTKHVWQGGCRRIKPSSARGVSIVTPTLAESVSAGSPPAEPGSACRWLGTPIFLYRDFWRPIGLPGTLETLPPARLLYSAHDQLECT